MQRLVIDAPQITATLRVRMYAGHLDLEQPLYWTIDDALDSAQCERYIQRIRSEEQERAPVITTPHPRTTGAARLDAECSERDLAGVSGSGMRNRDGVGLDLAVRNNTRVMWDSPEEAQALLARIDDRVPRMILGMKRVGANPRLRLYRYGSGEKHGSHWDTVVEFERGAKSLLTLVIYLNEGFVGGETDFNELGVRVTPRRGRALVFQHRVLHTATTVRDGEKFVLRTDIVFGPEDFDGPLVKLSET